PARERKRLGHPIVVAHPARSGRLGAAGLRDWRSSLRGMGRHGATGGAGPANAMPARIRFM
ncbi:MAG: hypothetical protein WA900_16395, partial [Casimicrobiaceae bacterium]